MGKNGIDKSKDDPFLPLLACELSLPAKENNCQKLLSIIGSQLHVPLMLWSCKVAVLWQKTNQEIEHACY